MSANDRCREAQLVLTHGGVIPTTDRVREVLIEQLEYAADGLFAPGATAFARAVLGANPALRGRIVNGDLPGLYEEPTDA